MKVWAGRQHSTWQVTSLVAPPISHRYVPERYHRLKHRDIILNREKKAAKGSKRDLEDLRGGEDQVWRVQSRRGDGFAPLTRKTACWCNTASI